MVRLTGRSVCSKKAVEDFWDVHFSVFVDSNMDGSSGNLFAVLVYYLKVGDVGLGVIVGNMVFENSTDDMTVVFL